LSEETERIHRTLGRNDPTLRRVASTLRRHLKALELHASTDLDPQRVGTLLALSYPERIALRRGHEGRYQSAGGRGMRLHGDDTLRRYELLAVAETSGEGAEATIRLAAPLSREDLESLGLTRESQELRYDEARERIEARSILRCGSLILGQTPLPRPEPQAAAEVLLDLIRSRGGENLPWDDEARNLHCRVLCAHFHLGVPWPDWSNEGLLQNLEAWLLPSMLGLDKLQSLADLKRLDLTKLLRAHLGWDLTARLDSLLPSRLPLPSGSTAALDYQDPQRPLLSARLQELFGWRQTPRVLEGRLSVSIELLSPARRPLALTQDLENFWRSVYPEVRKEMRGRYPKHYWPEDPFTAIATTRTKRGMKSIS